MLHDLGIPTDVAYFTVAIPVSIADHRSARATEIVARYLYSGEVMYAEVSDDLTVFLVLVRVEGYNGLTVLERAVTTNRDRLMSGLFGSTEPTYLTSVKVTL